MCATCGCGDGARFAVIGHYEHNGHGHAHDHEHHNAPDHDGRTSTETLTLEQRVLAKNDVLAQQNREWLTSRPLRAINLMSSPGAGKTTLLVRTIRDLAARRRIYVVEGDQETSLDADRIKAAGAAVLQVNTGSGCHLDASMLAVALGELDPVPGAVVVIENVGNLVCPALFDLGEDSRAVVMSVTEGADKPLKYPHIFKTATVVVLNKIDLLPYVDFDEDCFRRDLGLVNPAVDIIRVCATTGVGMSAWYDWLAEPAGSAARHPTHAGST